MTRLYRFALATVLATLALIAIGSLARLHVAGSGCGNDWPRCNGSWLPALGWEPFVEYAHRVVAVAVIVFAVATALTAFKTPGVPRKGRLFAAAGVGAILVQSIVGGLAARWGAPAGIAILHLASAMLFLGFALLTLAAVAATRGTPRWLADLGRAGATSIDRPFAIVAASGAAIALILLIFGASTSATGALACATWPLCAGGADGADVPAVIHLGYRATALLGSLAAAGSALFAWRRGASTTARNLARAAVLLVALQSGLNGLAAVAGDPSWMSAPHLIVATLFWITMLGVALAAWAPQPARIPDQHPARAGNGSAVSTVHDVHFPTPSASDGTLALASPTAVLGIGLGRSPLLRHVSWWPITWP